MLLKCFTLLLALLLLSGCEWSNGSLSGICKNHPELCEDIQTAGWCRNERADLIRLRYKGLTEPKNEDNHYRTLLAWETFRDCINVASQITHIKAADKVSIRTEAYLASLEGIKKLEQQVSKSSYPPLVYYRWSHFGNERDLKKLLRLDRQGKMRTTEQQLMIASYYAKYDKAKELAAHHKALEYLTADQEVPYSSFASLATNYYQNKEYDQAYVWSVLASNHQIDSVNLAQLQHMMKASDEEIAQLEEQADDIMDQINQRRFATQKTK